MPEINTKDAPAIKGDGVTDATAAIRAAAKAGDGIVELPAGTILFTGLGTLDVTLRGQGKGRTILKVSPLTAATRALTAKTDVTLEDLTIDAGGHTTMKSGAYAGKGARLTVRRCGFVGFMPGDQSAANGAVCGYGTSGLTVEDGEFQGCGRAVNAVNPTGPVTIRRNEIAAKPGETVGAGVMCTGIRVAATSGTITGVKVLIEDNDVTGATLDKGKYGAEGHGITTYRICNPVITGNRAERNGRGITASYKCFGAVVQRNETAYNYDAGIRVEPEITSFDTTIGTDGASRGMVVTDNVSHHNLPLGTPSGGNYGIGVEVSFAAGSIVSNNLVYLNGLCGIHNDSDRVAITGNVAYDNGQSNVGGKIKAASFAGIYLNAGVGCTITGNQCFDNQATKTQNYGLTLNTGGEHVVGLNNLAGNRLADVKDAARAYAAAK